MANPLTARLKAIWTKIGKPGAEPDSLGFKLHTPVLVGTVAIVGFFGVFGTWAAVAPLAGGAIAPGIVNPQGSVRTVQHLEGGIIRELLVSDGDRVETGDPLVVLQGTQARADFAVLENQRRTFEAVQARLEAEQSGDEEISFPQRLLDEADRERDAQKTIDTERALFSSRKATQLGTGQILQQRIEQLLEEIRGFEAQIKSDLEQLDLIEEEVVSVQKLVNRGLERKPRLLGLKRRQAEIKSAMSGREAAIARARQQIGETEIRIQTTRSQFVDEASMQLADTRARLASVSEQIEARRDVLARTIITAPVSGVIVGRKFATASGVIQPGEPILDIVPDDGKLQIEARVAPTDIDIVYPGLKAQVHLLSFAQRSLPTIEGKVTNVSANSFEDQRTGERYYNALVVIDADQLKLSSEQLQLTPGMPADVLIVTGHRTLLSYLFQPVRDSFRRSFREE